MAVKVIRYRTLIFYSDVDSNECRDHILKMQEEGWERIDERSLVDNGYEVEFEKWVDVDLSNDTKNKFASTFVNALATTSHQENQCISFEQMQNKNETKTDLNTPKK